jgi:hypothetical protein
MSAPVTCDVIDSATTLGTHRKRGFLYFFPMIAHLPSQARKYHEIIRQEDGEIPYSHKYLRISLSLSLPVTHTHANSKGKTTYIVSRFPHVKFVQSLNDSNCDGPPYRRYTLIFMAGTYSHILYSSFARRPLTASTRWERDGGGHGKRHPVADTFSGDPIRRAIYPDPMVWCPLPFGATPDRWKRTYVNTLKNIPPGQLVIDVGALDGADAISMAMAGHRVISMDPTPSKVRIPLHPEPCAPRARKYRFNPDKS